MIRPARLYPDWLVGGAGAWWSDQFQLIQPRHVCSQGVIAATSIHQESPVQACGVVEQVEHGYLSRDPLILAPEFRNVAAQWGVELDLALRDQAHRQHRELQRLD